MGFCQWAEMGPKVGWRKPTFAPTLNQFRDFRENPPFWPVLGGGRNLFSKKGPEAVPTQHNHLWESPHPRAPKPKSLKMVFPGLPASSVKKAVGCRKSPWTPILTPFSLFFGCFWTFSTLFWHSGPRDLLETFFWFRAQSASGLLYMAVPIVNVALGSGKTQHHRHTKWPAAGSIHRVMRSLFRLNNAMQKAIRIENCATLLCSALMLLSHCMPSLLLHFKVSPPHHPKKGADWIHKSPLTFFTQISGRKFLPELCGEVHP